MQLTKSFLVSSLLLSACSLTGCVQADTPAAVAPAVAPAGAPAAAAPAAGVSWPGTVSDFHGYVTHDFKVDGCDAKVAEPKKAAAGKPWLWRAEFWDAFPALDIALLEKGYHLAYINVGNTHGAPSALKHWEPFYELLTKTYGFNKKPVMYGMSRGGLYVYRWTADNTEKVGVIVGDVPVCDFKSWPAAKGKGQGSPSDWTMLIDNYKFKDEAEALAYKGNPIDILAPIAKAKIPIIHMVGDADVTVPVEENTDVLRERYLRLGGEFATVIRDKGGHHGVGPVDATPLVNFILAHVGTGAEKVAAQKVALKSGESLTVPDVAPK